MARERSQPVDQPSIRSSQGPRRLQLDQDGLGEGECWSSPAFDHSASIQVAVPGASDLYDQALWGYQAVAWCAIELPPAPAGGQAWQRVVFGQVNFHGEAAHHLDDLERLVTEATAAHLRTAAGEYPNTPLVVTEFGTPEVHDLSGDARFTEDHQAAYIEAAWRAIADAPDVAGGVLWCWADYHHRRDFIGHGGRMLQSAYGPYGVVTVDRQAKKARETLGRLYGGTIERSMYVSSEAIVPAGGMNV